jgi:hypothetical protein
VTVFRSPDYLRFARSAYRVTGRSQPVTADQLDRYPWLLNVENGTLDLLLDCVEVVAKFVFCPDQGVPTPALSSLRAQLPYIDSFDASTPQIELGAAVTDSRAVAVTVMHQVSSRMRNQDHVSKRQLQFRM